jgi:hypothetical protein
MLPRNWTNRPANRLPDPDVYALDPRFDSILIKRIYTRTQMG